MNILFLYKEMKTGGAEKVIFDTARALYEINKIKTVIATKNSTDSNLYEQNNMRLYDLPFATKGIKGIVKCLKGIYDICKNENIQIIHSHHRLTTVYALLISKILRVKVVHTEHNVFPDKNKINIRGKNIISVSQNVMDNLIKNGVNKKNIKVIYNGIDMKDINEYKDIKNEYNIPQSIFCFGVIARLAEQKGLKYLIESYSNLETEIDSKIIIIGDGELKQELLELVKTYKLDNKVIFAGHRSDVKNIISSLDCFILPSIYEGFPVTNLEIMMKKRIVIATNVGGNSEIIKNDKNGFLIESQNQKELIDVMKRVLENQTLLKPMEEEAYKTIEERFNMKNISKQYIEYYKLIH